MKVKVLIELLQTMNQEAEIKVSGGFVDYATTKVEVVEDGDIVNIQEMDNS